MKAEKFTFFLVLCLTLTTGVHLSMAEEAAEDAQEDVQGEFASAGGGNTCAGMVASGADFEAILSCELEQDEATFASAGGAFGAGNPNLVLSALPGNDFSTTTNFAGDPVVDNVVNNTGTGAGGGTGGGGTPPPGPPFPKIAVPRP